MNFNEIFDMQHNVTVLGNRKEINILSTICTRQRFYIFEYEILFVINNNFKLYVVY
jgi:hypothetical protein